MKALVYLLLFVLIVVGLGFAFFTMTTPDIPQQVVTKTLNPKDAFDNMASTPATPMPVAAPVQAPAPTPPPAAAPVTPAPSSAE